MDNKSVLRVVVHFEEGLFDLKEDGTFSGSPYRILKDLEYMTNLTVKITGFLWKSNPNASGDPFIDDLVPLLSNGSADIAGSYYYLIIKRATKVIPLLACNPEKFKVYFRQPHFTSVRNVYLYPFKMDFLIAYFLTILLLTVLAAFFLRQYKPICFSTLSCLREGIWWMLTFFSLKNYSFPDAPTSLKVIILTSSFFFTLIYYIYSAFLISSLSSNSDVINSIIDLINKSYTFYTNPTLSTNLLSSEYFKTPKNPLMNSLDSFKQALKGSHAHVDHEDAFKGFADQLLYLHPDDLCRQVSTLPFLTQMSSGFYISKKSPLRGMLNLKITRLGEIGLLYRYNKMYIRQNVFVCRESDKGKEYLSIVQVAAPFLFLLASVPIVGIFFISERVFKRFLTLFPNLENV